MSPTTERALGAVIVIAGLGFWAYQSWVVQPERVQKRLKENSESATKRFQDWAYVANQKEIAPGETIKLVVIPSQYGVDLLDTKCLVYTHQEFKTASLVCPNASQETIDTGQ